MPRLLTRRNYCVVPPLLVRAARNKRRAAYAWDDDARADEDAWRGTLHACVCVGFLLPSLTLARAPFFTLVRFLIRSTFCAHERVLVSPTLRFYGFRAFRFLFCTACFLRLFFFNRKDWKSNCTAHDCE